MPPAATFAASSRFGASVNTIFGDLPPNSKYTRFIFERAAYSINRLPMAPDPVKTKTSTSIDKPKASPTTRPSPVTALSTPGGKPASRASSAMRISDKDAVSEGFKTTEFPIAKAGPSFHAPIIIGKFQGIIAPTTPTGSLCIIPRMSFGVVAISP